MALSDHDALQEDRFPLARPRWRRHGQGGAASPNLPSHAKEKSAGSRTALTAPRFDHGGRSAEDERVFVRGDHTNLGSSVPRGHIKSLGAESVGPGSGRLQVAQEITSEDNPTAARVAVNRMGAPLWPGLGGHT